MRPLPVILAVAWTALAASGLAYGAPEAGQPAPTLRVAEFSGEPFDLGVLKDKTVIVNFWATWCTPCRAEMPALDAFFREHHAQGLEVIGLSLDRARDRQEAVEIMKTVSYPGALLDEAVANGFGRPGALPVSYVIGPDGVVRSILRPDETAVTEKNLADLVLPLLRQVSKGNRP